MNSSEILDTPGTLSSGLSQLILCIHDRKTRQRLQTLLQEAGLQTESGLSLAEIRRKLTETPFPVILVDSEYARDLAVVHTNAIVIQVPVYRRGGKRDKGTGGQHLLIKLSPLWNDEELLGQVRNFLQLQKLRRRLDEHESQQARNREQWDQVVTAKQETQAVFDALPDLLLMVDLQGRVQRVNRRVQEMEETTFRELLGRHLAPELRALLQEQGPDFADIPLENFQLLENGRRFQDREYLFSCRPAVSDEPRQYLLIGRDVTEHNQLTRKQKELELQLIQEAKLSSIGLLTSGLAHNLNSPLQTIIGFAQLLQMKTPGSPELDNILKMANQMRDIINNLMFKLRQEQSAELQEIDLNQLLQAELTFLESNLIYKHEVVKEFDFSPDLKPVKGIYSDFSQGLTNIVNNALDAMYHSDEKVLRIATRFENSENRVIIEDTGCGIPPEQQKLIFNPFFTTKPSLKDRNGDEPCGTGLGLSSSFYLLAKYGVRFDVESTPGKGTRFTISFPT